MTWGGLRAEPFGPRDRALQLHRGSGAWPYAGLIRDAAGNLYGTTYSGGNLNGCYGWGCGVVFELSHAGQETVLYTFTGGADGAEPEVGVIQDAAGNLYGTTKYGGSELGSCANYGGCGVVFKLTP